MEKTRAKMGQIPDSGILPLLHSMSEMEWSGALRLRRGTQIGAIWYVKGQIVHAAHYEGKDRQEGIDALENLAQWNEGTYLLEADVLPPARSIRIDTIAVMERLETLDLSRSGRLPHAEHDRGLDQLLTELRQQVPGLESLSISQGSVLTKTTELDDNECQWLNRRLRSYMSDDAKMPETLYVHEGDHTLLVINSAGTITVLAAQPKTPPEALFWAGAKIKERVSVIR